MRATLLFPPQWTAAQPYYGLATLNGQLRASGADVRIRDLNLAYMESVLSPDAVSRAISRLESDRAFVAAEHAAARLTDTPSERASMLEARLLETEVFLREHAAAARETAEDVGRARDMLRDREAFYEPARLIEALVTVDAALRLASLPYYPAAVRWNDFFTPTVPFNLDPMLAFCRDPLANPFYRFLEKQIAKLEDDKSDLYAVSIASFSQVLPGMTLAMMIKQRIDRWRSAAHGRRPVLTLGGNFFSRLKTQLEKLPRFFELFADSVVIGEGERSTVELAKIFDGPGDPRERFGEVSSMLHLDARGEKVVATPERPNLKLEEMAFQDLTGFELDRYLAPERVVCLRASKGCYYGKCAFCDCDFGLSRDELAIDRVVAEIRWLRDNFGVRHIEFVDQCIAPAFLNAMCDAFIAADLNVRWFCNARTDQGFETALFEKMRRAGNTMLMWGVESGSPRLLKLMKKGVSARGRLETLAAARDAGLFNFAYIFFGFPTETEEEAMKTIDLIRGNTDVIHGYGRSVFSLGRHARMMEKPEEYGILEWIQDDQDLSTNLTFRVKSGLEGPAVMEMADRCNALCRAAYGDPLWMALRSRENLHLYLAQHGRDYVQRCDVSSLVGRPTETSFVF